MRNISVYFVPDSFLLIYFFSPQQFYDKMVLQNRLGFNPPYLPLSSWILEGLKTTPRYEFLFETSPCRTIWRNFV